MVDRDHVVVGFTRLRRTRFRENVEWVKLQAGVGGSVPSEPARIAAYDLRSRERVWEVLVEPHDLHAVFGIYRA